jgi:hypothetical protein
MEDTPASTDRHESTGHHPEASSSVEELRKVCAQQDRAREALKRKLGVVDVAVDLVREARDE